MQCHGFTLLHEAFIPELATTAKIWQHDTTKSQLLSCCNSDENKVFGVTLRTPPADSTGVAHILEHSVLCGSAKYPVKEPFVELLKGSLQTFLNAFTYPDKTCYPVASTNLADFYNLIDVYLDAVFFPRISEVIFQQEGWHLEATDDNSPLVYKGVVYNEMKGAFSSPESVLGRHCLHALFPDTVYALESGGDPQVIPSLTYEDFVSFHKSYYHPTNARFYFWGNDPEDRRLARLNDLLKDFTEQPINSAITDQPFLPAPRSIEVPFAASSEDQGMMVMNWLGPQVTEIELGLAFRMLEHILLGMPASPLRRALIESGLGEDIAGQGLETELRQLAFDVGLKGIDVTKVADIEELILSTLQRLVDNGIPQAMVEAAINTIEFSLRENNEGRFPVGLAIMLRALTTWLHDADPLQPLAFEQPLASIKQRVASGEPLFENMIRTWLLDNTHRVTVTLIPDSTLSQKQETEEQATLEAITATLSPEERLKITEETKVLMDWQSTPDSAAALATIPRLHVADLPKENILIPTTTVHTTPPIFFHGLNTNGIAYVEAHFNLSAVPERLLPLLPLLGRALLEMDTQKRSFVDLNMEIAKKTGGMETDTLFLTHLHDKHPVAHLSLSGKVAPDAIPHLFDLLGEVLTECDLTNKDRFLAMALEEKARHEHSLIPAGHQVVAGRLRASASTAGWMAEHAGGIQALFAVRQLIKRIETEWPKVLHDLVELQRCVFARNGLSINITAMPEQQAMLTQLAEQLCSRIPENTFSPSSIVGGSFTQQEALLLPAQVNYVGKGINVYDAGFTWHGSAAVIVKYLRTGYLWEKVRVQGGAYGCICSLDRATGAFSFVSYRDPNIAETLAVFDNAATYLQQHIPSKEELNAAIIGAIGELDTYLLPDAKGTTAFIRHLCGDTDDRRQQLREEILSTNPAHFAAFGKALTAMQHQGRICALGGNNLQRIAEESGWPITQVI